MSNRKQTLLAVLIILASSVYLTPTVHAKGSSFSVTTVPVGINPVPEAFDPANGNMYVANSGEGTVSVISSSTNTVVATIVVGSNPAHVTWNPVNSNVYVSNRGSSTVSVISSSTNTVIATDPVAAGPHVMAFDFANGNVYVASDFTNLVSVISSQTNAVTFVTVGAGPMSVTYDFANHDVYACNFYSNTVSRINSSTNAVTATINVGAGPGLAAFDPANGNMYVPNTGSNTVSVISSSNDAVLATVPVGSAPNPTFYDPTNKDIYVTNRGSNFVSVIDSGTNAVIANVLVGPNPYFAVFNPVDKDMFVTDHGANTVSVIDSNSQTVIATITVGSNPHAAAFDFTNAEMYVSNDGSNTVSAISISHPTPGVWTTEAPRPIAAEGLGATEIGSTIFAIGGGPFPNVCHNDAYDTAANSWSTRSPMPVCVAEPSGVVSVAGLVYVISGGCQISTPTCPAGTPGGFPPTSAVQIYNPRTDKWSMGGPIPTPRARGGAAVYNGKIFVIGGHNTPSAPALSVVEIYDTVTNTWTTAAPMPTGREGLLAATVGDKIFAIGGFTVSRTPSSATNVVEEYNIVTNTWTTGLAPMPTPRGAAYDNGGVACGNQPIFVIGGDTAAGPTKANEAYIPSLNTWISRPAMSTARGESGTGIVGSQLFVIGGSLSGQGPPDTNANEAFQCATTVAGKVDSGGAGISGTRVILSDGAIPIAAVLTTTDGFYHIDLPAGGTYTVSATTLSGTAAATVSVAQGTITIQNLST